MAAFIVVDDHPLARIALRLLLEQAGHTVVAETDRGEDATHLVRRFAAEALVMDIDLPGIDGIQAIASLRAEDIHIPVIVVSGKNTEHYAAQSLKAGANGFVSKQNHLSDFAGAVSAVFSGYGYFPLHTHQACLSQGPAPDTARLNTLSRREFEVLRYFSKGLDISGIASCMQVSNKTVSTYKTRLMHKLNLENHRDLLDFARRHALD
ncbi:response regulator [Pantoea sp. Ae16]|uniref:response regulator n=1 Tax=Pantoea sp. Ae16 TaxID=1890373 RepID=UPI0008FD0687|nr:response regulator [Pantoea sp. Ae16]OIX90535.1 DNA-binding response regulator [Pantoea sp. Ae16]